MNFIVIRNQTAVLIRSILGTKRTADFVAGGQSSSPSTTFQLRANTAKGRKPSSFSTPTCLERKPLRIVRVVESGLPRAQAGRMVISGRMADVCAELDRLCLGST